MAAPDMAAFVEWFVNSSLHTVRSAENMRNKLRDLKHMRACKLHVYCRDGRVPPEKSVPFENCDADPASICHSPPQGTRTQSDVSS